MNRKWIVGVITACAVIALVAGTAIITLRFDHYLTTKSAPNSPPKSFPDFSGSQIKAQLQTEQVDGIVHYKLDIITAQMTSDDFQKFLASKASPYLHFDLDLQDIAGFSVCKKRIDHEALVNNSFASGLPSLEANGTIADCEPNDYLRISKWAVTSNLNAVVKVFRELKTN